MARQIEWEAWQELKQKTVSAAELSEYLMCSVQYVGQLRKRGILWREPGGKYNLVDAVHSYLWHRFGPGYPADDED